MEQLRKGTSGGRIPIYDQSFKIAIVREFIAGQYSQTQVAKKHNISEGTMRHFLKWYKKHFPEPSTPDSMEDLQPPAPSGRSQSELEKELAYAQLKITALEMLISNAEREMGVDIRKKPGSKPSTK